MISNSRTSRIEYCPACGAYIPEGFKHCLACGKSFKAAKKDFKKCEDCTKYDQAAGKCDIGFEYLCSLKHRDDDDEPEEIPTVDESHANLLGFQTISHGTAHKPPKYEFTSATMDTKEAIDSLGDDVEELRRLVGELIEDPVVKEPLRNWNALEREFSNRQRELILQSIRDASPKKDDKPPIIDLEPILGGNGRVKIGNMILKDARIEPPGMKIDMEELGLARDMTGRARRGKLMAEVTLTIVGEVE